MNYFDMENSIFLSYSMSRQVSRQLPTRKIAALRQLGFMFGLELGLGGTFSLGGGGGAAIFLPSL